MPPLQEQVKTTYQRGQEILANAAAGGLGKPMPTTNTLGLTQVSPTEPAVVSSLGADKTIDKINDNIQEGQDANTAAKDNAASNADKTTEDAFLSDEETEQEKLTRLRDEAFASRQNLYDELTVANTEQTNAYIESLKTQWQNATDAQKKANKFREGVYTQAGYRTGEARYTPEHNADVLAEVQSQGQQKLQTIDSKYNAAINDAKAALKVGNFELAFDKNEEAQQYYQDALDEISAQTKSTEELLQKIKDEENKTIVGDAVYNAIASGMTDVQSIYKNLRDLDITTTPEQVQEMVDSFIPDTSKDTSKNAYEFDKDDVGKLISVGFTGEDIQATQDIFNKYGLYGGVDELEGQSLAEFLTPQQFSEVKSILYPPPKGSDKDTTAGSRDYNSAILITRLGKSIYGTRISDAESERVQEFVDLGMAAGKSEYEIMDDVLGFSVTRNQDLASGLRNTVIANAGEDGLAGFDMLGLARLINNGNDMEAVRKVENEALRNVKDVIGDTYVAEADVDYINNKVSEITQLLGEGWMDEVGAFTGSLSSWLSKKFGWGEASKIKAKITSITAELTNKRAGSAITDTEWERLVAANVPAMSDSAKTWTVKMDELVADPLSRYNSIRSIASLPELNIGQISSPETRISLYSGGKSREAGELLDSFDSEYSEDVWGNAE